MNRLDRCLDTASTAMFVALWCATMAGVIAALVTL